MIFCVYRVYGMKTKHGLHAGRRLTRRVETPGNDEPRSGRQSMPAHDVPTRRDAGRGLLDVLRRGQRPAACQRLECSTGRTSRPCRCSSHTSEAEPEPMAEFACSLPRDTACMQRQSMALPCQLQEWQTGWCARSLLKDIPRFWCVHEFHHSNSVH